MSKTYDLGNEVSCPTCADKVEAVKAAQIDGLREALVQVKYESDVLAGRDLSDFEGLDSVDVIQEQIDVLKGLLHEWRNAQEPPSDYDARMTATNEALDEN